MIPTPHSLAAQKTPDVGQLWASMIQLVDRVGAALHGDAVLTQSLDVLVDILGADRGLVLIAPEDGRPSIVHARGPNRQVALSEPDQVSQTFIRRALETDAVVVWERASQPVDAASVGALGLHAALVAPLHGRGVPRAVLYVDFRHPLKYVEPAHQEFFMAAVVLIGAMMEQSALAQDVRERLREAAVHATEVRQTPLLNELTKTESMASIREEIAIALHGDSPILVLGESGCGKTLFARAIAEATGRKPVVRIVLGASDDLNTITSELFGHERGSFSGAAAKRVGLVEYAHGGTLILDEVLNLPAHTQKLLLDFTQFGTYRPLGYSKPEPRVANVRIIAATNGDLDAAMREGRFRQDLYYRLAGVTLRLPPLRARRDDIATLAESALTHLDTSRQWRLSMDAQKGLTGSGHDWPGNVRELEWAVRRARDRAAARHAANHEILWTDFTTPAAPSPRHVSEPRLEAEEAPAIEWQRLQDAKRQIEDRESILIRETLARHGGVIAHAAKSLGIARTTLAGWVGNASDRPKR